MQTISCRSTMRNVKLFKKLFQIIICINLLLLWSFIRGLVGSCSSYGLPSSSFLHRKCNLRNLLFLNNKPLFLNKESLCFLCLSSHQYYFFYSVAIRYYNNLYNLFFWPRIYLLSASSGTIKLLQ